MSLDIGMSSAKKATWRETDTRPLLLEIVENNPKADDPKLLRLFWSEVKNDKDRLFSIVQRFVDLELRALRSRARLSRPSPSPAVVAEMRQRTERTKERLTERIDREAESKLLSWLTPSGKPLGECTGAYCKSVGGWLSAVAEKVPAKATVGETLSEKQVYRLWQANAR